jgi:hypothetical protein
MSALTQHLFSGHQGHPALAQKLPTEKRASDDWYVGDSDIQGQGVFAGRDFDADEVIGLALTAGDKDEWDSKIWNLTLLARKCNHQTAGYNVEIRKKDDHFELVALKPISQDDELVSSYYQVSRAIGPRSQMRWEGKDVPSSDFEDFIEKESGDNGEEDT